MTEQNLRPTNDGANPTYLPTKLGYITKTLPRPFSGCDHEVLQAVRHSYGGREMYTRDVAGCVGSGNPLFEVEASLERLMAAGYLQHGHSTK